MTGADIPLRPAVNLSPLSLLLLAKLTLFWGVNWPVMKFALGEIPVFTFRALCLSGGAAGLLLVARLLRQPLRVPQPHWLPLLWISLFNVTAWNGFILYGLSMLPAGRTTILAFTMPLWVAPISAVILGERLTGWKLAGLATGLAGLLVLLGGEWSALEKSPLGVVLVLCAAISWAIGTVLIKKYPVPIPSVAFAGWQALIGGVPIVVLSALFESHRWQMYSPLAWSTVIYNTLICLILCSWIWNRLVRELPAQVSGLSTLMIPVVGVFSSMLMLGERPGPAEFAALALIALALAATLKPQR